MTAVKEHIVRKREKRAGVVVGRGEALGSVGGRSVSVCSLSSRLSVKQSHNDGKIHAEKILGMSSLGDDETH